MSEPAKVRTTVLEVLSDALNEPVAALVAQPVIAAHAWDSMTSLEVLAQLESRLGVEVDLRSYHAVRTVDELILLAEELVATATAGSRVPPR